MSSIDREQFLFWSEIREEERSEESKTALAASGNQRQARAARNFAYRACTLATHRSPVLDSSLRSYPWIFEQKRETPRSLCPQPRSLLVT